MDKKLLKKYLVGDFTVKRLIRSFLLVYFCVFIFGWFKSTSMIFQPHKSSYRDSDEIIKLKMYDGPPISGIYLKNKNAKYTVLYNHANATDLGDIDSYLSKYKSKGFSMFSYDYRGYGTSPGKPTTANAYKAADTAINYLVDHENIRLDRIIVHGRSVGGGPALHLAKKWGVAGLIVESSFVTAFRTMTHIPLTPFDKFRNIAKIDKINCPVLVIHGIDDRTIPLWHGEKLFKKAKEPKANCWLEGTDHNYMPLEAEEEYWSAISAFTNLVTVEKM